MRVRGRLADVAGSHADRGDQAVAGRVALILALATPESVFVVGPCVLLAGVVDDAAGAHGFGCGLTSITGLGPFGGWREEQVGEPFARRLVHPAIVCEHSMEEDLHRGHVNPLVRNVCGLRLLRRPRNTQIRSATPD